MCVQGNGFGPFPDAVLSILSSVAITSIRMRDIVLLLYLVAVCAKSLFLVDLYISSIVQAKHTLTYVFEAVNILNML